MSGITKTKAIAYLVAVFLAGTVSGGFVGFAFGRHAFFTPPRPEAMAAHARARLASQLHLTAAQVSQTDPIITETCIQISDIQASTFDRIHAAIRAGHERMRNILDAAQWEKLEEMDRRHEESVPRSAKKCDPTNQPEHSAVAPH